MSEQRKAGNGSGWQSGPRSEEGPVSNGKDLCFIQNEMVIEEWCDLTGVRLRCFLKIFWLPGGEQTKADRGLVVWGGKNRSWKLIWKLLWQLEAERAAAEMGKRWRAKGRGGPCSQILDVFVPGKLTRSANDLEVDVSKRQVWRMSPKDVKWVSGKLQSLLSNPGGLEKQQNVVEKVRRQFWTY